MLLRDQKIVRDGGLFEIAKFEIPGHFIGEWTVNAGGIGQGVRDSGKFEVARVRDGGTPLY